MIETKDGDNFRIDTVDGISKVGGGAMPLMELHTRLLRLSPLKMTAQQINEKLKSFNPPVIVRVEQDSVLLDVRTIQDKELKTVAKAINEMNSKGMETL
jgi:L-seryl-tRNA(Ser) seleniumtransferase